MIVRECKVRGMQGWESNSEPQSVAFIITTQLLCVGVLSCKKYTPRVSFLMLPNDSNPNLLQQRGIIITSDHSPWVQQKAHCQHTKRLAIAFPTDFMTLNFHDGSDSQCFHCFDFSFVSGSKDGTQVSSSIPVHRKKSSRSWSVTISQEVTFWVKFSSSWRHQDGNDEWFQRTPHTSSGVLVLQCNSSGGAPWVGTVFGALPPCLEETSPLLHSGIELLNTRTHFSGISSGFFFSTRKHITALCVNYRGTNRHCIATQQLQQN